MASGSSDNAFVSGAVDLRFKSRAGQIRHSMPTTHLFCDNYFALSCVDHRCNVGKMRSANLLHAFVNTASIIRRFDLILNPLLVLTTTLAAKHLLTIKNMQEIFEKLVGSVAERAKPSFLTTTLIQ